MSAAALMAAAAAAWTLGFNGVTLHTESDLKTATPGVYIQHASGWTAGALRNGADHWDAWAGRTLTLADTGGARLELMVGGAVVRHEGLVSIDTGCKRAAPSGEPERGATVPVCRLLRQDVSTRLVPMLVPSLRVPLQGITSTRAPAGAALRISLVPRAAGQAGVMFSFEAPIGWGVR